VGHGELIEIGLEPGIHGWRRAGVLEFEVEAAADECLVFPAVEAVELRRAMGARGEITGGDVRQESAPCEPKARDSSCGLQVCRYAR
jgi:hypothetical protein